jgi:hypothetical protein
MTDLEHALEDIREALELQLRHKGDHIDKALAKIDAIYAVVSEEPRIADDNCLVKYREWKTEATNLLATITKRRG